MRALVREGYLGGAPVHMESYYCYELKETGAYARALLGDKQHWVRKLPGQLLHNIISHGIAKVAEYLAGEWPEVRVVGFPSRFLEKNGEQELVDELRVIITDEARTTAYFTFSTQMRPGLHDLRVYGPENGLVMDEDQQTLIKLRGGRHKSYAEKFIPHLNFAGQHLRNLLRNGRLFLASDFHMDSGKNISSLPSIVPSWRELRCPSRMRRSCGPRGLWMPSLRSSPASLRRFRFRPCRPAFQSPCHDHHQCG